MVQKADVWGWGVAEPVTFTWRLGALPEEPGGERFGPLCDELVGRHAGAPDVGPANPLEVIAGGLLAAAAAAAGLRCNDPGAEQTFQLAAGLAAIDKILRTGPPVWIGEPFLRMPVGAAAAAGLYCEVSVCLDLFDHDQSVALDRAPLVVEDGSCVPGANSYLSVESADERLRNHPGFSAWSAASRDDKEQALKRATLDLDEWFRWRGVPVRPVLRTTTGQLRVRELLLTFRARDRALDVAVAWETDTVFSRRGLSLCANGADVARVFYPPHLKPAAVKKTVDDMIALIACHLIQAGVIDLRDDDEIGRFLGRYLRGYRGADTSGPWGVLGPLLKNLTAAQDFRGFRKYVARTIRGLAAQRRDRATLEHAPDSVQGVAARIGCTPQALYYRIQRGRVRTEKRDGTLVLPADEIGRLECEMASKIRLRAAIRSEAAAREMTTAAVRKRVQRARVSQGRA